MRDVPAASFDAPIVITGTGLVTPLGLSARDTWQAVRAGVSGMGPMPAMEQPLPPGSVGGQAPDLPEDFAPTLPREARHLRWAILHALAEAGLATTSHALTSALAPPIAPAPPAHRRVLVMGTTLHGLRAGGRWLRTNDDRELRTFLAGATSALAAAGLGLDGGSFTTCSACSSSLGAVALGVTLLRAGLADVVVAGGYDAISEYAWAGFSSLRLVSPGALRPFCAGRQGMKLAEGYAAVVLERAASAADRGAPALACVAGWGESADAHHLTQPHPQGEGAVRAMRDALARAGVTPAQVGLIAAHATGTPDNDAAEAAAITAVFSDDGASGQVPTPVVGFKSHLGHTLGGAGAVELVLTMHALREGVLPPTAGVSPSEIEFSSLRVTTGQARPAAIAATLNTSLGFGGANTCVVLTREPRAGNAPAQHAPAQHARDADLTPVITGVGLLLPESTAVPLALVGPGEFASGILTPGTLDDATLGQVINARRVRRLSPAVKYTLTAATLAMRHARLEGHAQLTTEACAILASAHGSPSFCADYYAQIVRDGVLSGNPVLFAEGVPNAAAAHLSTTLGIKGACQTIIGTRTSGLDALALAAARVAAGDTPRAFVVAAEESHPTVQRGYDVMTRRGGLPIGRGAVALIIESRAAAIARGAPMLATIGPSAWASLAPAQLARGVSRVLAAVNPPGTHAAILCPRTGTWLDRATERAQRAANQLPGNLSRQADPSDHPLAELFAVAPLVSLVSALLAAHRQRSCQAVPRGAAPAALPAPLAILATDWTGLATAVLVRPDTLRANDDPVSSHG